MIYFQNQLEAGIIYTNKFPNMDRRRVQSEHRNVIKFSNNLEEKGKSLKTRFKETYMEFCDISGPPLVTGQS